MNQHYKLDYSEKPNTVQPPKNCTIKGRQNPNCQQSITHLQEIVEDKILFVTTKHSPNPLVRNK